MNTMSNEIAVCAIVIALAACVTDVRGRRIPNVLTFGAALAGVIVHTFAAGWEGAQTAAFGWAAGTALFLPLFLLGGMGAGDVKLLAALGTWLGAREAVYLAVFASVAGGVFAVAVAVASGYLRTALGNVRTLLGYWFLTGIRPLPAMTLEQSTAPRLAFALPIFAGTVVTLWVR